ncbi:MAG: MG2 domain-containing protein [Myxococcota bacterium]
MRTIALLSLLGASVASAQPFGGFELSLHGERAVTRGRATLFHGRAFEVRGVARLRPLPRAVVRARYRSAAANISDGPWAETRADADGHFTIDVAAPSDASGASKIEFQVGDGERSRTIETPVQVNAAETITLRTDRAFYQPGESVHVWTLLRDADSGAPLENRRVSLRVGEERRFRRTVETTESGVAHATFLLRENQPTGTLSVRATHAGSSEEISIGIGQRTQEQLLVTLEASATQVAPGSRFEVKVRATTPAGAPVRGATVELEVQGTEPRTERTNDQGEAIIAARAPAYLQSATGRVRLRAQVRHAGHGSAEVEEAIQVAAPLALQVDATASGHALAAGVSSRAFLHVTDTSGAPAAEGTFVVLRGPGLRRPLRLQTDVHGLVDWEVEVPRGDVARHEGGACANQRAASFDVTIEGRFPQSTRICLPVDVDAAVRPEFDVPVLEPGATARVRLYRRPSARGRAVTVVLLHGERPLVVQTTRADELRFEVPPVLGRLRLLAWIVGDPRSDVSARLAPGVDALLVRPASPQQAQVEPASPRYSVGAEAELRVQTSGQGWIALDVRDLAQHGLERPFQVRFLEGAVRKALLDPSTPELTRLARASLAAALDAPARLPEIAPLVDRWGHAQEGSAPAVVAGDLRDPLAVGAELRRRGLVSAFSRIESMMEQATSLDALVVGEGRARRLVDHAPRLAGVEVRTLGDEALTMAALQDLDASFRFDAIARRIGRLRLVDALAALSQRLGEENDLPPERWVSTLSRAGVDPRVLRDLWGGTLGVRSRPEGVLAIAPYASDRTLAYPGPDGRLGTADDIVDPFARAVPEGTPYAVSGGEDALQRAFAVLSVGPAALTAMVQALARVTRAQEEAMDGDAVAAEATGMLMGDEIGSNYGFGGLGLRGTGTGGGGIGYGRGAGGLRGRNSRVPRVRTSRASVQMSGSLRGLVREDMPATLRFVPSLAVDESGLTRVPLSLADAATTYLVEVVHWRDDGWISSASTRVEVHQDLLIDAPVPRFATEGDRLRLPLRVARTSAGPVALALAPEGELRATVSDPGEVDVPAGEARMVPVEVALQGGDGHLRMEGRAGSSRDAVRRPLTVLSRARRTTRSAEVLIHDGGASSGNAASSGSAASSGNAASSRPGGLFVDVPADASPRGGGQLWITTGAAFFEGAESRWLAWARALKNASTEADQERASEVLASVAEYGVSNPIEAALALGIAFRDRRAASDAVVDQAIVALSGELERDADEQATLLLALAPALRQERVRPELSETLAQLTTTLRAAVNEQAAARSDDPALQAAVAAALAWTGEDVARVREYLRRADRGVVSFGEDRWLQGRLSHFGSQNYVPSALLALARLAPQGELRDRGEAFALLRTLASRASQVRPAERSLAAAAAELLATSPLASLELRVDGRRRRVELENGVATLTLPGLDRPGPHQIEVVDLPAETAVHLRARVEFAVPWSATARRRADFAFQLAREGDGALRVDQRDTYELEVRNLRPRTTRRPVVEVALPTGAELDAEALSVLRRRLRRVERDRNTLRLHLRPLLPGRAITLPLQVRWTVGGELRGLGMVAYEANSPERATVAPPEVLTVEVAQ